MKKIILTLIVATAAIGATAQPKKTTTTPVVQATPATNYASNSSDNEMTVKLGFSSGALHFGADYNRITDGSGPGGYFFYQTDKKSNNVTIVAQVISFGGDYKINVADTKTMTAYISPGFGIHMAKEVGIPNATTGKQSDETLIGPVLKIGAQFKVNQKFSIGLERKSLVNWFNDSVLISEGNYYSVAGTFTF